MTIADILTTMRLVLTPFFVAAFVFHQPVWAILIFSVAGFTDLIDGTVARLLKQHSVKGALLDPLADKLLVESCFICLFIVGVIPWWFFLLALGRDLMIVSGIFYLEHLRAPLPYRATLSSKIATILQLIVAIMGLIFWWQPQIEISTYSLHEIFFGALVSTALLLIISGSQYIVIGIGILRKHQNVAQH